MRILMENVNGNPWRHVAGEDTSGQNLFVREIAEHLAARGQQVDVATRVASVHESPILQVGQNLRLLQVPAGPSAYLHRDTVPEVLAAYVAALSALLNEQRLHYDIVHGNYWPSAAVACRLREVGYADALIYTPHSIGRLKAMTVGIENPYRDRIESEIFEHADAIHAISEDDAAAIRTLYEPSGELRRIPHGVNHAVFSYLSKAEARERLGWAPKARILLFVGRFEPQKNLPAALRAYDVLADGNGGQKREVQMVVCGGPAPHALLPCELPEPAQTAVRSLRHPEKVRFIGRIRNGELRYYYAAADVLLAWSNYEPFGLVAAECVSCGTPVAATRVGGLRETIADGVDGLLGPVGDEDALKRCVETLLADSWQDERNRQTIARRAERLSWDSAASALEDLYGEVHKQVNLA